MSRERLLASVARAIDSRRDARQDQRERSDIDARLGELTERERQVLEQLVMGRTNKFAAHELGISSRTVEVYRRNVMAKMGADSLSHLVRMTLVAGSTRSAAHPFPHSARGRSPERSPAPYEASSLHLRGRARRRRSPNPGPTGKSSEDQPQCLTDFR